MSRKVKASDGGSKLTGANTAESNAKPSEMLLDLNDDCGFITRVFLLILS